MRFAASVAVVISWLAAGAGAFAQQPGLPVPETVPIPAGEFLMGSEEGAIWEQPVHKVRVSAFRIGKQPVTNREFQAFRPEHPATGGPEDPVKDVSWHDAQEYCRWLSAQTGKPYRLPTEAEWERAIRGGLEQKTYPWGDEPPFPEDQGGAAAFDPAERPNAFGMLLSGDNSWEWTADRYDPEYYANSPRQDPQGPAEGKYRVLRGGGYRNDPNSVRCANRGSARPETASGLITFRVAMGAKPKPQPPRISEAKPREPAGDASTGAPFSVTGASVESSEGELTLILATSGEPVHRDFVLSGPDRLVIDFPGAQMEIAGKSSLKVGRRGVKQVRWAQFKADPPVARVVVDLSRPPNYRIEKRQDALVVRLGE